MSTEHVIKFSNMLGTFKILVGECGSRTVFEIHRHLLMNESKYFITLLTNASSEGIQLQEATLPDEYTAATFETFCQWLYRQSKAVATITSDEDCVRAYLLGEYLQASNFVSACKNELRSRFACENADAQLLKFEKILNKTKNLNIFKRFDLLKELANDLGKGKSDMSQQPQDTLVNPSSGAEERNPSKTQGSVSIPDEARPVMAASKSAYQNLISPAVPQVSTTSAGETQLSKLPRVNVFHTQNSNGTATNWPSSYANFNNNHTDSGFINTENTASRGFTNCQNCKGGGLFDKSRSTCATCNQAPSRPGFNSTTLPVSNNFHGFDGPPKTTLFPTLGNSINPQPSCGLFGALASNKNKSAGLGESNAFGNQATPQTHSGGLFGTSFNNTQNGGLFGNASKNTQNRSLFDTAPHNAQSGSLLDSASNDTRSGSLFGNTSNNAHNRALFSNALTNKQSGGLFGNVSNSTQNTNTFGANNLFGQPVQRPGLFGGGSTNTYTQTNALQNQPASSNTNASQGLFGLFPNKPVFWSESVQTPGYINRTENYQTISAHPDYRNLSLEEMRYTKYMNASLNPENNHQNSHTSQSRPFFSNSNTFPPAFTCCLYGQPQAPSTPPTGNGKSQTNTSETDSNAVRASTCEDKEKAKSLEDKQRDQAQAIEQMQAQLKSLTTTLEKLVVDNEQRSQVVKDEIVEDKVVFEDRRSVKKLDGEGVQNFIRCAGMDEEAKANNQSIVEEVAAHSGMSTPTIICTPATSRSQSVDPVVIVCPDDDDDNEEEVL